MNDPTRIPRRGASRGPQLTCRSWSRKRRFDDPEQPRILRSRKIPPSSSCTAASGGPRAIGVLDAILATLKRLGDDESLLIQSGKPVAVFKTHPDAPRVLIANSNLVPKWATWEHFNELDRKGLRCSAR